MSFWKRFVKKKFKDKEPDKIVFNVLTYSNSYVIPTFTINFLEDQNSELAERKIDFFVENGLNHYVGKMRKQVSYRVLKNMKTVYDRSDIMGLSIKYPVCYDFKKSKSKNLQLISWVDKLHDNFKAKFDNLMLEFGSVYNLELRNYDLVNEKEIKKQMKELNKWYEKLERNKKAGHNIISIKPPKKEGLGTEEILQFYQNFPYRNLCFEMNTLKYYNDAVGEGGSETPYRMLLKEIFRYSEKVDMLVFRDYSLKALFDDSNDSRKSVTPNMIVDFCKICKFSGIINFDIQVEDEQQLEESGKYIRQLLESFVDSGYRTLDEKKYTEFMKYQKNRRKDKDENDPILTPEDF